MSNITHNQQTETVTPRCLHYGECGGCTYQSISYKEELHLKEQELIKIFAHLELPENIIQPITTNNEMDPWHYRSRMDFLFHNHMLSQRKKGNFRVKINLNECHIALPVIGELLKAMNKWFHDEKDNLLYLSSPPGFNHRVLKYVTIRKSAFTAATSVTFILNRDHVDHTLFISYLNNEKKRLIDFLNQYLTARHSNNPNLYSSKPTINILVGLVSKEQELSVSDDYQVVLGNELLNEKLCGADLKFHSQGFFQNNSIMIEKIISRIRQWHTNYQEALNTNSIGSADYESGTNNLYDLYGGCGVFAATLGKSTDNYISPYENLWLVDTESNNVNLAGVNIEKNTGIIPKVFAMGVSEFLSIEMYHEKISQATVVLDPPRSGLGGKVLKHLIKNPPRVIFYVSCKPATLAEELITLKNIYEIKEIVPFDLFPRTPHLEALALLIRR